MRVCNSNYLIDQSDEIFNQLRQRLDMLADILSNLAYLYEFFLKKLADSDDAPLGLFSLLGDIHRQSPCRVYKLLYCINIDRLFFGFMFCVFILHLLSQKLGSKLIIKQLIISHDEVHKRTAFFADLHVVQLTIDILNFLHCDVEFRKERMRINFL